jgi:flagellar biosynthetic protein FlhB
MSDQAHRTEQPTPRKLEKARKEGRFPVSRHFLSGLQFALFVAMLIWFFDRWIELGVDAARHLFREAYRGDLDAARMVRLVRADLAGALSPALLAGAVLLSVTAGVHLMTTKMGLAVSKLTPDFNRLNPMSRLREMPGRNLSQAVYALGLLALFMLVAHALIRQNLAAYLQLPLLAVPAGLTRVAGSFQDLLWKAAAVFLLLGIIDLMRERRRYIRQLRMTKQEVRDEMKEIDGNPLVKMRIRRIQRDLLRRKMMSQVPKATAVIVNPTHYAVAIRYDMNSTAAPKVVAKGKNYLALRIRQKAVEHQVPIVENPPLAQALYKSAHVGQEIPVHLYRAVAEILAYIYRLMGGKLA